MPYPTDYKYTKDRSMRSTMKESTHTQAQSGIHHHQGGGGGGAEESLNMTIWRLAQGQMRSMQRNVG